MPRLKSDKAPSEYVRSELEFLAGVGPFEPVIAIITENDEIREQTVDWLRNRLSNKAFVIGLALKDQFSVTVKKLNPDILIGDSMDYLSEYGKEIPLVIKDGGYICFRANINSAQVKEWLQLGSRGQHLIDAWQKLIRRSR